MGTGMFLELLTLRPAAVEPSAFVFVAHDRCASNKIPIDLGGRRWPISMPIFRQLFGLISTHFITGFVPRSVLAPKINCRLGGSYWS